MEITNWSQFEALILSRYKDLPRNQKKIAGYVLNQPLDAAFLSVVELGEKCGASKATAVRFSQSLGFKGYLDFRQVLNQVIRQKISKEKGADSGEKSDLLVELAEIETEQINQVVHSVSKQDFDAFLQVLHHANKVFISAPRLFRELAELSVRGLLKLGISAILIPNELSVSELANLMNPGDALCCFHFPPFRKTDLELMKTASKKGIKCLVLSEMKSSPVLSYADVGITVRLETVKYPRIGAALLFVLDAIRFGLAKLRT